MHAVISGRAGRALVLDGESLTSFDVADPSNLVPRKSSDLPFLFGESRDLRIIENSEIESIGRELKADSDLNLALDLTLISHDAELEDDIRKDAIRDLDELLSDSHVVARLENILYARPLPDDGDLVGALRLCADLGDSHTHVFFRRLQKHQSLIGEVSAAWEIIPTKAFASYDHQAEFQYVAVREGLFRALVLGLARSRAPEITALQAEVQGELTKFFVNTSLNQSVKELRNHRQVLQSWINPFRPQSEIVTVEHEIDEEEREAAPRRRHGRRVGIDRPRVLREVNKKKAVISEAMQHRDFRLLRELVDDLVDYQLKNGEPKHAAKSLCDLAMEAKDLGMAFLQLELTERSISVAPDDGWSWAQHGDALLNMQRSSEALEAYQQADAFGAGVVAKTGRAEVFKAEGEFKEALAGYDEVIRQHPENVVAMNGRAEVLKAQGEYETALAAYDEVITQHPENDVARRGRAETLKVMGELAAALAAFDDIVRNNPKDARAKNGRSSVLAALGRYDEALTVLPEKDLVTLDDWIGFYIRGMLMLRTGKMSEAIRIFDFGLHHNPWVPDREVFGRALALGWLRGRDFKKAARVLDEVKSPLLQPTANVLRIHAFGALGDRRRAVAAYESLSTTPYLLSNELTQELRHQYILSETPRQDEEWIADREVKVILLAA